MIAAVNIIGTAILLGTIGLVVIGIIKVSKSGGLSKIKKESQAEETRMIQEIYHGLSKMEERIETLETILIERRKSDV